MVNKLLSKNVLAMAALMSTTAFASSWEQTLSCYTLQDRFGEDLKTSIYQLPLTIDEEGLGSGSAEWTLENNDTVKVFVLFQDADKTKKREFPSLLMIASLRQPGANGPVVLDQASFRSTEINAFSTDYVKVLFESWQTYVAANHTLANMQAETVALNNNYAFNPKGAFRAGHIDRGVTHKVTVGCAIKKSAE